MKYIWGIQMKYIWEIQMTYIHACAQGGPAVQETSDKARVGDHPCLHRYFGDSYFNIFSEYYSEILFRK